MINRRRRLIGNVRRLWRRQVVTIDWNEFECRWVEAVIKAIAITVAVHPTERLYAGAFWLLYGDCSSLHVPAFGLSCESSDPEVRWHPPDWRWSLIDEIAERMRPLYVPLLTLHVGESAFESLWEQHIDMLSRVSRRVTESVRAGRVVSDTAVVFPGFFVGIIDFGQGDDAVDYLRRSVDAETIAASGILRDSS
jgi:hypothetical protein